MLDFSDTCDPLCIPEGKQLFQMILLSQRMVKENVEVLIAIIRLLTVCSNNLNVDDGMNFDKYEEQVAVVMVIMD